jgi:hypothetical protein
MSSREDQQHPTQRDPMPGRLQREPNSMPTQEEIREIRHNLTGFFAVLREWAERAEKARPPPTEHTQPLIIQQIIKSK